MSLPDSPGKRRIIAAGRTLVLANSEALPDGVAEAVEIASDWIARHIVPMGIIETDLHNKTRSIDSRAFTSQRLKRLGSAIAKLSNREALPGLSLWNMHDLGGCRAVLPTNAAVRKVESLYAAGRFIPIRKYDYIATPKQSGYRGIHLILKYHGSSPSEWDGMQIEVQLRSRAQHIFATAVETVGYFVEQPLKSSRGDTRWLNFFRMLGSWIALAEGCPVVPGTPPNRSQLYEELQPLALDLVQPLDAFTGAVKHTEAFRTHARSDYYVLTVNEAEKSWRMEGFKRSDLDRAVRVRLAAENAGLNSVVVSTESIADLWEAYPNYFLDLNEFMRLVRTIAHGRPPQE